MKKTNISNHLTNVKFSQIKIFLILNTFSAAGYDSTNNTLKNAPQESKTFSLLEGKMKMCDSKSNS